MSVSYDCRLYWTKAQMFKFIHLVREHPQLWNPQNKHFRNQFQRDLAYDTISYEMGITNEVVKKKIHILRSQYNAEVKKLESNHIKHSVWPYFNALKFFNEPHLNEANEIEDSAVETETVFMEIIDDYECEDNESTLAKESNTRNVLAPYKWDHAKTLQLIETYQKYPELYNSNCFDFRNKYKRNMALENIAKEMGTTTEAVKKKIHSLRTTYTTEVKKMKQKNCVQSRWVLFDALKFLYDEAYYTPRPRYNLTDPNIDSNNESALEDIIEYVLEDDNMIQDENSEDGSASLTVIDQLKAEKCTMAEQQPSAEICVNCKERDEFSTFGETIALELRLTKDHEEIHNLLVQQILKAVVEAKQLIAESSD